jgi:hypothetical protein
MTDQQDIPQAEVEGQLRRANEEAEVEGQALRRANEDAEVEGQRIRANEEADSTVGDATTDDGPEVEGQGRRRFGPDA